jgi:hypothetical protein
VVEELFNLKEDVSESSNLIDQHPEKAKQLSERLRREKEAMQQLPHTESIQPLAQRLQSAVRDRGYREDDYWVWCGSVIKGGDGKPTHLFMATTGGALPYWKAANTFNVAIPLQADNRKGN